MPIPKKKKKEKMEGCQKRMLNHKIQQQLAVVDVVDDIRLDLFLLLIRRQRGRRFRLRNSAAGEEYGRRAAREVLVTARRVRIRIGRNDDRGRLLDDDGGGVAGAAAAGCVGAAPPGGGRGAGGRARPRGGAAPYLQGGRGVSDEGFCGGRPHIKRHRGVRRARLRDWR